MKIIVFSDGTGNSSAKVFRTNVWRLYDALDLGLTSGQVAFYDNGVGTASFKPLALLGGAFGWGLKRNVLDIYKFICRNYATRGPHEIQAFGFSRGAFTIRVLLGLIRRQGLVPYTGDERELARQATWAYRRYREQAAQPIGLVKPLRMIRNGLLNAFDRLRGVPLAVQPQPLVVPTIAFVGLWDTVAAYGFPIVEITRAWDKWVWPLGLPTRQLSPNVVKACHALGLDDERQTFHPLLWTEASEPTVQTMVNGQPHFPSSTIAAERVSQVWFSGMHSNVGGGYPDDGMSYDSLCWIAGHAVAQGLVLKPNVMGPWRAQRSPMADSRGGVAAYYRYLPRAVRALCNDDENAVEIARPKIHVSVFDRIATSVQGYAPIGLPEFYAITDGDTIFDLPAPRAVSLNSHAPAFESVPTARARCEGQQRVWDAVWYRRIFYFLTVLVTVFVAILPVLPRTIREGLLPWPLPTLSALVGVLEGYVPSSLGFWLQHFRDYPLQLLVGALIVLALMTVSAWIEHRASDTMRGVWQGRPPGLANVWLSVSHAVRTSPAYIRTIDTLRYRIAPHALGAPILLLLVVTGAVLTVRLSFDVPMLTGHICQDAPAETVWAPGLNPIPTPLPVFRTRSLCQPMGASLERDVVYEITMTAQALDWMDKRIPVTSFEGFETTGRFWLFVPLRRHKGINWFVPVARVGSRGDEYHPITQSPTWFRPQVPGQLFMYVNDALSFYPSTFFYDNNDNEADITGNVQRFGIRRVGEAEVRHCGVACPF
jgi:uncharacterized protein (DUF2235 family)